MAAFVATEKLVRKTNVTTHAANGLMIHHFYGVMLELIQNHRVVYVMMIEERKEKQKGNLEVVRERERERCGKAKDQKEEEEENVMSEVREKKELNFPITKREKERERKFMLYIERKKKMGYLSRLNYILIYTLY
jgi:hypothetical protein